MLCRQHAAGLSGLVFEEVLNQCEFLAIDEDDRTFQARQLARLVGGLPSDDAAQHRARLTCRIGEAHMPVRAVAERLVLRRAAAAQRVVIARRAVAPGRIGQPDAAGHVIGAIL